MKKICLASMMTICIFAGKSFAVENRTMTLQHLTNASSYFSVTIQDSGLLKGTYPGWCADWANQISDGVVYHAKFYSPYSAGLPAGLIAHPEHLDEMNWLINQHMVGELSPTGLGIYTSGDVQLAIWTLIDDDFNSETVGPFSQARVDELVAMALSEGSNFYPNCKQVVGIILDPGNESGKVQTTVPEIPTIHFPKCAVPEGDALQKYFE